jgi:elongation factor P
MFGDLAIGITLPNFVNLRVTQSDPWVKGDTAAGNNKPATVETGYTLQVPSFVEQGVLIQIDTRTGEYVTRVKE